MPTKMLSPDLNDQQFNENRSVPRPRFRHSEALGAETSEWVELPAGIGDLLVSVAPVTGTARVEYTQDSIEDVRAGSAGARPWPDGDVGAYTETLMANSVTAIRCVSSVSTSFKVTA